MPPSATPIPPAAPRCGFLTPDPAGYRCQDSGPFPAATYVAGTTNTGLTRDDEVAYSIPIGFTFNYYGANYTTVRASSNGNIQFTTGNWNWGNTDFPADGFGPTIMGFWDDLYLPDCTPICQVRYTTVGSAPNRTFAIEWYRVPYISDRLHGMTWEIQLKESSNDVYVLYKSMNGVNRDGNSATLGLQGGNSAAPFFRYSFNQPGSVYDGLTIRYFPAPLPTNTPGPSATPTPVTILVLDTAPDPNAVVHALNEIGVGFTVMSTEDWTGINYGPYSTVIAAMDGGLISQASIQAVRTNVVDAGKRLIFIGGTCWQDFAIGVNTYLLGNDINNYCWTMSGLPSWTLTNPSHGLAAGLPATHNWADPGAGYYQTRPTDPLAEYVARNGDDVSIYFYKNAGFAGDFIWFTSTAFEYHWTWQPDFDMFKQIVYNSLYYVHSGPTLTPTSTRTPTRTPTPTHTPTPVPTVAPRCQTPDPFGYRCDDTLAHHFINVSTNTGLTGDDQVVSIPIGFTFNFYGTGYTTANVSSNGNIQFTTANAAWFNGSLPDASMGRMIAPFWDDLYLPTCYSLGCRVYYGTTGSAPNRIFTVEWYQVDHICCSGAPQTFQVQMEEATGDIWVVYQTMSPPRGDGSGATLGIQDGSNAFQYSFDEPVIHSGLAIRYYLSTATTTFTFDLAEDGLSDISIPLNNPSSADVSIVDAESLAVAIETQGGMPFGPVQRLLKWAAPIQNFLVWSHEFGFGDDFATTIGYPYILRLSNQGVPPRWS
jgi:hypothetical protein